MIQVNVTLTVTGKYTSFDCQNSTYLFFPFVLLSSLQNFYIIEIISIFSQGEPTNVTLYQQLF